MTWNRKLLVLLLIVSILIVSTLIIRMAMKQEKHLEAKVNENVMISKSFSIDSISSGLQTSAKGTAFVKRDQKEVTQILVVASVEIDPKDWGGVAFYFPDQWTIKNITSNYPDNKPTSQSNDYIATWASNSEYNNNNWNKWVEIGRDRRYIASGGGKGTVIIELVQNKNDQQIPERFEFGIEIGSKEEAGKKVMGTETIKIPLSLTEEK